MWKYSAIETFNRACCQSIRKCNWKNDCCCCCEKKKKKKKSNSQSQEIEMVLERGPELGGRSITTTSMSYALMIVSIVMLKIPFSRSCVWDVCVCVVGVEKKKVQQMDE
jgi:hypothetical protein